jgi:tetratricopeptide (TPR) repeat protein|tara:strand:+ start:95 stop:835 length:741 start_codon:yes stop_codon:yes gene_type:complete
MFKNFSISLLLFSIIFSQSLDKIFEDGNSYYNQKSYNKAIENYNKILDSEFFSQDLYLNLGNAYFKTEDFGNARWSYEMGLKLNPLNDDLKNNNNVNKSFIENYVEVPENSILDNLNLFFQFLSLNQFMLINSLLILLTSMLFFIYRIFEVKILKKIFIYFSVFSIIFLLLTITKGIWDENNKFGIIIKNDTVLYSAPYTNESIEISVFYSGNKIKILQSTDSWFEIYSFDGRKGWIRAQDIRNLY